MVRPEGGDHAGTTPTRIGKGGRGGGAEPDKVPFYWPWEELSKVKLVDNSKTKIAIELKSNAVQESDNIAIKCRKFNCSALLNMLMNTFQEASLQTADVAMGIKTPEVREHCGFVILVESSLPWAF